eukprot:CAMPEP_0117670156 /NCGR_PEP_ID=MMETSP0804-20121206/12577_1 /TAXON_ID=1074897 /ORGANISM="Tetraselmis astigmatica, Strain CCMP880" /LENGTH=72 /DNA_ID=CAMNT_0005478385 /DNA_START=69 /DNA_END=284 /DNA_ORIENTATION=-
MTLIRHTPTGGGGVADRLGSVMGMGPFQSQQRTWGAGGCPPSAWRAWASVLSRHFVGGGPTDVALPAVPAAK